MNSLQLSWWVSWGAGRWYLVCSEAFLWNRKAWEWANVLYNYELSKLFDCIKQNSRLCASLFTRSVTESDNLCRLFVVIHLWSTPLVKRRFDTVKLFLLIAVTLQENSSLVIESQRSEWLVLLTHIVSESDHSNFGRWVGSSNCTSREKKLGEKGNNLFSLAMVRDLTNWVVDGGMYDSLEMTRA